MQNARVITKTLSAVALIVATLVVTPLAGAQAVQVRSSTGLYTIAPLSDGRQQAFRSVEGAAWIESRWEVSRGGRWTPWYSSQYPPATAGVSALHGGIQNQISYLIVDTDDGLRWRMDKVSVDSNGSWTPYYRI